MAALIFSRQVAAPSACADTAIAIAIAIDILFAFVLKNNNKKSMISPMAVGLILAAALSFGIISASAITDMASTLEYFIPLPESDLLTQSFQRINKDVSASVTTTIMLSVSTTGTIIVWDHWEDGYDAAKVPCLQSSTQIWGDGNATNGCAPSVSSCTDETDHLVAGQVIAVKNSIQLLRAADAPIAYDGGDFVTSTHPISITQNVYPEYPGPSMTAQIEVYDTTYRWGTEFVSPVACSSEQASDGFGAALPEYSAFYCMAAVNDTTVMLNGGEPKVLSKGQTIIYADLKQGDRMTANKDVQVTLVSRQGSLIQCSSVLPSQSEVVEVLSGPPNVATVTSTPSPIPVIVTTASTQVAQVDPSLWKLILVGSNCPATIWEMKDFIQNELFMAMQARMPKMKYVAPGNDAGSTAATNTGKRRLRGGDDRGFDVCPKNCNRPKFADWCIFMGCGCMTCGDDRRILQADSFAALAPSDAGSIAAISINNITTLDANGLGDSKAQGPRSKVSFNTWTDYSREKEAYNTFVVNSETTRSTSAPPPHDYIAMMRDMNYILSNLAASLVDPDSTDTMPPCYMGAKLVAV